MNTYLIDILANIPLMTIVVTVIAAILVEAAPRSRPVAVFYISLIGSAAVIIYSPFNIGAEGQSFGGMIIHGGYAGFFSILFNIAVFITVIFSREYFTRQKYHRGEFYILLLFADIGMMLIASANDLIVIFLGIELMSICLYVLAGFIRSKDRANEAALKYFLLGAFSTGFLLYGIALIYGAVGTTNLTLIRDTFASTSSNPLFILGSSLLMVGFAFKAAVVPFHMWAPDVYEGAPTTVTGFMSTAAKAAAFAAFVTVFIRVFDFMGGKINEVLAILSAFSMITGNIIALAQTNIKRMLAYSSIAHAGYMLSGIATGTPDGQTGVLYYIAAYMLMNLGAFAVIGIVEKEGDQNLLVDDYAGMRQSRPLLSALMAIFMFALAGVPPLAGFFGKYYVFLSVVKANMTWLAVIGVLTSLVSAYYYLRVVVLMYFREKKTEPESGPSAVVMTAIVICAVAVIFIGLFPSLIVNAVQFKP
jgi:NADH-quinone oxidoreductase subunit N